MIRQKDALAAIKDTTDEIDDALLKIAGGIVAFWIAVVAALASFVAELMAESAAAATVVGAPPAAAGAAVSSVKVVGLVATAVGALGTYLTLMFTQATDLRQRLDNNNAFQDAKTGEPSWPRSTADMSDGSLLDNTDTGWHIK